MVSFVKIAAVSYMLLFSFVPFCQSMYVHDGRGWEFRLVL